MTRLLAPLLVLLLAGGAHATDVRVTAVKGPPVEGALVAVDAKEVKIEAGGGDVRTLPLAEIVGIEFLDPAAPPIAADGEGEDDRADRAVSVRLAGGDLLRGVLLGGTENDLALHGGLLGAVKIPLDAVRDVRFESAGERAELSRHEGDRDSVTYRSGDVLTGWLVELGTTRLEIDCVIREDFKLDYDQVAAIHLNPEPVAPPAGLLVQLQLVDGERLTGREPRLEGDRFRLTPALPPTGREPPAWTVPLAAVRHLTVRGGAFVHLSDLPDLEVKVVPFFPPSDPMLAPEEWLAPRHDRSFLGRPLTLGGRVFHKGLGVVSGTTVKVALDGEARLFRATVGVDDHAGPRGSVVFEILVDGRSRWKSPLLRTGMDPVAVPPVNLSGAKTLELRVSHGDDAGADVQDFADWGEPILIRG